MSEIWNVSFVISRQKTGQARHFETYLLEVDPDEYVLDGVERIWADHDRSLTFRHACHHSTCGACGMLVNGVEKLTCITSIRSVAKNGGTIKVEPMRNFPVVSDLVVDMGNFYMRLEQAHFQQVVPLNDAVLPYEKKEKNWEDHPEYERLVDCIECGLCISACPIALTTPCYVGPGVLAAIQHSHNRHREASLLALADRANGLWRCHSAFECSAVCPSNVDPAWRIMDLRKRVIGHRVRHFLGLHSREKAVK